MCVNGRGRGGLELPEELDGGETDGGAQNFCRRRLPGAPAVERSVLGDASESGECARVLGEARGVVRSPEFSRELVGDGDGAEMIGESLVALDAWGLGRMKEEEEGI